MWFLDATSLHWNLTSLRDTAGLFLVRCVDFTCGEKVTVKSDSSFWSKESNSSTMKLWRLREGIGGNFKPSLSNMIGFSLILGISQSISFE